MPSNQKAFTLLEVLVAMTIILSVTTLMVNTVTTANLSSEKARQRALFSLSQPIIRQYITEQLSSTKQGAQVQIPLVEGRFDWQATQQQVSRRINNLGAFTASQVALYQVAVTYYVGDAKMEYQFYRTLIL